MATKGIAHAVHHDRHYEYCYSLEERQAVIRRDKPKNEKATRLSLLGIVPIERLPDSDSLDLAWKKADVAWKKADVAWEKYVAAKEKYIAAWEWEQVVAAWEWEQVVAARKKYVAARKKYIAAWEKCVAEHPYEVQSLHDELWPDCTWDGVKFVYASD